MCPGNETDVFLKCKNESGMMCDIILNYITDVERPKQARGEKSRDVNTTILHEIARSTALEGSQLIKNKVQFLKIQPPWRARSHERISFNANE